MNVAIIPARGGSKRIPRKNIKLFFDKPMISYSIEAAINSKLFDRIIVSTDDEEISGIALEYGAEVPFIRPADLSCDQTTTVPVVKHTIEALLHSGVSDIDYVCCIYAAAPFIMVNDLKLAYEKIQHSNADYCLPVTTYPYPVQRSLHLNESGLIKMKNPEYNYIRSQDLDTCYHDVGQFYFGRTAAWLQDKPILSGKSLPIIIPRMRVQDIDTQEDWDFSELMYEVINRNT